MEYVELGVRAFKQHWNKLPTEIVSGRARGIDVLGEEYAIVNGMRLKLFPVSDLEWQTNGPSAGHLRNGRMAEYAEALIAIWDGKSRGTRNMITQMAALQKPVTVLHVLKRIDDTAKLSGTAVHQGGTRPKTRT